MEPSQLHYFPLAFPFYAALFLLLAMLFALVELHVLAYAYEKMGVPRRYVFGLLLLSLLGSSVNFPVAQLPDEQTVTNQVVSFYGVQYVVPVVKHWPGTVIAVNVGGAVIPTLLAGYLLVHNRLYGRALAATLLVALAVHFIARPVRGVGIVTPVFAPPLIAASVALLISWRSAPPLAYIAGSLGTLIGADLMNLDKLRGLGAPIASIGGAGTFDGIFLTGILAVVLTWTPPRRIQTSPPEEDADEE